jgi:hypothetical protein
MFIINMLKQWCVYSDPHQHWCSLRFQPVLSIVVFQHGLSGYPQGWNYEPCTAVHPKTDGVSAWRTMFEVMIFGSRIAAGGEAAAAASRQVMKPIVSDRPNFSGRCLW